MRRLSDCFGKLRGGKAGRAWECVWEPCGAWVGYRCWTALRMTIWLKGGERVGKALAKKSATRSNSFFQFFIFPAPNQDFDFSEFFSWSRLPILASSSARYRTLILSSWSSMVLASSWSLIIVPLISGGLQVQFLPWLQSPLQELSTIKNFFRTVHRDFIVVL